MTVGHFINFKKRKYHGVYTSVVETNSSRWRYNLELRFISLACTDCLLYTTIDLDKSQGHVSWPWQAERDNMPRGRIPFDGLIASRHVKEVQEGLRHG